MQLHTIFFDGQTATLYRRTSDESALPYNISQNSLSSELQSAWGVMTAGLNGLLYTGESLLSCEVNSHPDAPYEWEDVEVDDGNGGTVIQQQPTAFRTCVKVILQIRTTTKGIRRIALTSEQFSVPQVRDAVLALWNNFASL